MNNFVVDVDMSMNPEVVNEAIAKQVKGTECFCCKRSNAPLLLHEEDNVLICENCLYELQYSYYDSEYSEAGN